MKIALHHYGDVNNYGDILFPRIIVAKLSELCPEATVDLFSATRSLISDLKSEMYSRERDYADYDAVLIAGGEIVHLYDEMLIKLYSALGKPCIPNPTDLVFGIARAKSARRMWIGLGVPPPNDATRLALRETVGRLTHVSVRGHASRRCIQEAVSGVDPAVIPDVGWLIPWLAKKEGWASPFVLGGESDGRYIVAQMIPALLREPVEEVAKALLQVRQHFNVDIVLMPITDCWNDSAKLNEVHSASGRRFRVLPSEITYEQRAVVLMQSCGFIGQSLHGAITVLASGKPALVVYPPGNDQKFSELLTQLGLERARVLSWSGMSWGLPALDDTKNRAIIARVLTDSLHSYFRALFCG